MSGFRSTFDFTASSTRQSTQNLDLIPSEPLQSPIIYLFVSEIRSRLGFRKTPATRVTSKEGRTHAAFFECTKKSASVPHIPLCMRFSTTLALGKSLLLSRETLHASSFRRARSRGKFLAKSESAINCSVARSGSLQIICQV